MAYHAIRALETLRPLQGDAVKVCTRTLTVPTDHTMDHLAEIGLQLRKEWERTGDHKACIEAGKPYGIHSPYHATAIIRKAGLPETFRFTIHALQVGGIGIAIVPYEMYDTNGVQIKENSPFAMTVIATCANTMQGYVPSRLAWEHGGYSCDTTRFCPGSGEEMAEHYLDLLNQLHAHKGE